MNCSHVIAYHDRDAAGTAGVAGCAGIAGTAAAAGLAGLPLAPATQPTTIPRGRGSFRPGTGRSACHEATPLRPKIERRHAPSHVADRVSVHPATDTVGPVVNRVSNSYPFRNLLTRSHQHGHQWPALIMTPLLCPYSVGSSSESSISSASTTLTEDLPASPCATLWI